MSTHEILVYGFLGCFLLARVLRPLEMFDLLRTTKINVLSKKVSAVTLVLCAPILLARILQLPFTEDLWFTVLGETAAFVSFISVFLAFQEMRNEVTH